MTQHSLEGLDLSLSQLPDCIYTLFTFLFSLVDSEHTLFVLEGGLLHILSVVKHGGCRSRSAFQIPIHVCTCWARLPVP